MRDFRKIIAWQLADEFTVAIYRETKSFPREEIYGLTSQIRRAAYSVPANIAEGASRNSLKDYLHFLYMARGSNSEAQYFTISPIVSSTCPARITIVSTPKPKKQAAP